MKVLVTGATGFVGSALCDSLAQAGIWVRAAMRRHANARAGTIESVVVGEIDGHTDWNAALRDVDAVIHVAARAHVMLEPPGGYLRTNADGTRRLAEAAAGHGVCRFVYLSSIKVNGEETAPGRPFTVTDEPRPQDPYGVSKWMGELALAGVARARGMQAAIVRSPLIYGPGVRANFLRLLHWIDRQRPLPLGAVNNRRSLTSIWNLCDLLVHLLKSPIAPGRTWMVSDGEDLSTPELICRIGNTMGRRVRLLPVPVGLLHLLGGLTGRKAEVTRLCGSLTVDISQTRRELGWSPPVTVDEALSRTVDWYLSERHSDAS